ncbi:hypothetical protein QKD39_gp04 [Psittacine adenovirus 1]|uniref:Uncharacterized protein n=1 Tax=Psittacine adenovirus 1 TaxID=318592 RepID=A0A2Z5E028_9ADEN|nr:hypothetical protein QKD39_gp04 [Psittacine adenovirus 1]AXB73003.1 hypothetical protein [Psittacine adenovirus 1]
MVNINSGSGFMYTLRDSGMTEVRNWGKGWPRPRPTTMERFRPEEDRAPLTHSERFLLSKERQDTKRNGSV